MTTSLTDFRPVFLDRVLDLLWRQWSSLGITGYSERWEGSMIDPEALVLTSCEIGRYDARLFDAMLEWVDVNGRFLNIQRFKRIQTQHSLADEPAFGALAETVATSVTQAKWAKSWKRKDKPGQVSSPEQFFFLRDGRPMPVVGDADPIFARHGLLRERFAPRGVASPFPPALPANLLLRLRSMFGVNARCEIIAYLLARRVGSPREIAHRTHFFPATIANALAEMRASGFVVSRREGRRRMHRLVPEAWHPLLLGSARPSWLVWPPIFEALISIWSLLRDDGLDRKSPLAQASALRRVLLGSAVELLESSIPSLVFGDLAAYPGEALLPFFIETTTALFDVLRQDS